MNKTLPLTCLGPDCQAQRLYRYDAVHLYLYTHGVCTIAFFCLSCKEQSEFAIPDTAAIDLDSKGVPSTIVHTPAEILEWPQVNVPPIQEYDVGIWERTSLSHFHDCVVRELLSVGG